MPNYKVATYSMEVSFTDANGIVRKPTYKFRGLENVLNAADKYCEHKVIKAHRIELQRDGRPFLSIEKDGPNWRYAAMGDPDDEEAHLDRNAPGWKEEVTKLYETRGTPNHDYDYGELYCQWCGGNKTFNGCTCRG